MKQIPERTWRMVWAVLAAALIAVVIDQSWAHTAITANSVGEFLVTGLALGSIYGVAAQGLVLTYATSGVFNFAQGAIGMIMAYVYWDLKTAVGMNTVLAVVLTVGVLAPILGVLIERVLIRGLVNASLLSKLVVTIGLLLALTGLAASIWNPDESRVINPFFNDSGFTVAGTFLPWYRVVTIVTGLAVGLGLRFLLRRTRLGITMRAVVDNRDLTVLNGGRPARASMTAWALGSSMAALAGIFLAEELSALDTQTLTLFIVDAFAAAIIARLSSLPMAYVGGLVIGLSLSFQENFLSWTGRWSTASAAIPAIILFIAVLFIPHGRIEGRPKPRGTTERVPRMGPALIGFAILFAGALICAATLNRPNVREVTLAVLTALVMVSLVPLTGWANQISLAQITLVGCGAFAFVQWDPSGSIVGLLYAAAFAVPIGLVMAGTVLRLSGIYLALATMAFARMAEFLFFAQPEVYGSDRTAPALSVFGWQVNLPFRSLGITFVQNSGYLIFSALVFCLVGIVVVWTRRHSFGRKLIAMRDSPAACATLGMNLTRTKLAVFAYSAAIAGLAGGMFAVYYGTVATADFTLLVGLPYLLLLVVGGVAIVGGAVFGGLSLVSLSWLQSAFPASVALAWLQNIGPGLAGIGIGKNPNGVWEMQIEAFERRRDQLRAWRGKPEAPAAPAASAAETTRGTLPLPPPREASDTPALELREISVRFGGLQAVKQVSIQLHDGMITGLIGPNGAGKTTLFNVATGLQEPNQGRIFVDGRDVTGSRPYQLARLRIARTFQRLETFGSLSVRDNMIVAAEMHRSWSHDRSQRPEAIADAVIGQLGLDAVASTRADLLPTGTSRLVEVGRALAAQPRVLLLDEPSSGLSTEETEAFAVLLRKLSGSGIAILLVEHDMGFIMSLCNQIVVLDAGQIIAMGIPREVQSDPKVIAAYLGGDKSSEPAGSPRASARERRPAPDVLSPDAPGAVSAAEVPAAGVPAAGAAPALRLDRVSAGYGSMGVLFEVSLTVGRGEVCALLGPNGAGKSTTLKVASGQLRPSSGTVSLGDQAIAKVPTDRLVRDGLSIVPEGRGVFPNLTVAENLRMASYAGATYAEIQEASFERFPKLASFRGRLAGTLSGGEQQMLAIARALAVRPSVLLIDELSMGLGPKIVEELYGVIAQIAQEGLTILVIEQFAHEVLQIADSAAVLINGRITHKGAPAVIAEIIGSAYLGGSDADIPTEASVDRQITERLG